VSNNRTPSPRDNGFLNINKPLHLTSHDVVARVRRILRRDTNSKKVGHAGTLDPLASGVLVICLNQATRLSDYVMHTTKTYRAHITFGQTTATYDAEGDITSQADSSHITVKDIENVLPDFIGDIQQIPPMYSAIKQRGKKLYELARAGEVVERPPRAVTIHNIIVQEWQSPILVCDVTCSSGTYIRSLAHDIGQKLEVGAYLSGLIRLQSGDFKIENAVDLGELLEDSEWYRHIIKPVNVLSHIPSLILTDDEWESIKQGRSIAVNSLHPTVDVDEKIMAYSTQNELRAILVKRKSHWKPHKVFLPNS